MATITKNNARKLPGNAVSGAPYGSMTNLHYNMTLNSSGVFGDSNDSTVVAIADVVRLGVIPAGMKLLDALANVSNVGQAATTASIGFAYVDGVDSTDVPEDADYFFSAGLDLATAARTHMTNTGVVPVTLPKDAYLILTNAGAAHDEAMVLDILITAETAGIV